MNSSLIDKLKKLERLSDRLQTWLDADSLTIAEREEISVQLTSTARELQTFRNLSENRHLLPGHCELADYEESLEKRLDYDLHEMSMLENQM